MLQETGAADGIYSQVRPVMLKTFLSMGWQQCSDEFVAPAWNGKWIAMWIDMQDISQNWHSQDFQKKWLARTGVRFDTKLWERVDRVMYTSTFWK
ncbi:MAG: hypothetical protein IID37_16500 [Planctomycetes bacterium]|nr:hypothetical protein [Planctomycetota bacterium]